MQWEEEVEEMVNKRESMNERHDNTVGKDQMEYSVIKINK